MQPLQESETDKLRILVVEDEKDVASLLKARLEANGYEVKVERGGRAALLDARDRRPDLVVLDVMLPDMDGYQVSKELRALYPPWEVRILMLTALGMPQAQLYGYAAGADAYLKKPYEAHELLGTVAKLLRKAR